MPKIKLDIDKLLNEKPEFKNFRLYKDLDKKTKTIDKRRKYYLENASKIKESLNYVNEHNPYDDFGIRRRLHNKFCYSKRQGLDKYLNNKFGGRVKPEHAIQRNLFVCKDKYIDDIGEIIGYEVDLPYENGLAKVDLVSYSNNTLYLIELKKCYYGGKTTDSNEQLIRAIMEIETYNSYCDPETLEQIKLLPELKGKEIVDVKRMIVASSNLFDDMNFFDESLRNYVKENIILKTISCNRDDITNMEIGTEEKLFKIEEYKCQK